MNIYKVTNRLNGKAYIGQTVQPVSIRWTAHVCRAKDRRHPLHKAIEEHGKDAFYLETLSVCDDKALADAAEIYFIDHFQTMSPNGYNQTTGGTRCKYSDEARERISSAVMGTQIGRTHKQETIQKMRAAHKGKVISQRQRELARINQTGKTMSAESSEKKRRSMLATLAKKRGIALSHKISS